MSAGKLRRRAARLAVAAGLAIACWLGLGRAAAAEPRRFALLIGQRSGLAEDEPLRFAESDAERVGAVLRDLGGFASEDIVILTATSAPQVRRSLISLNARLREVAGESILFVFYSGHADAEALHLAGSLLPMGELRDLVVGSPATARVLVVDACRSGGVTRTKGGRRAAPFAIEVDERLRSKGVAILSSSSEGEDSQESDSLSASFFTHYLVSALRGAADLDVDGRVTLVEAFTFASERTLAATSRTVAGPQHPTYRFDLAGREDLVLTRPVALSQRVGALRFAERGVYLVQGKERGGPVLAEVEIDQGARTLALPDGEYWVTRRASDHLLQGRFAVTAEHTTAVASAGMERVAYAQVARKGAVAVRSRWSATFAGGARTGVAQLGPALRAALGVRLDRPTLSFEARLFGGWSFSGVESGLGPSVDAKRVQGGRDVGASVAVTSGVTLGEVSLAGGVELGGVWISQELGTDPSLAEPTAAGVLLGVLGQAQRPLTRSLYLRLELATRAYLLGETSSSAARASWLWAGDAALGVWF